MSEQDDILKIEAEAELAIQAGTASPIPHRHWKDHVHDEEERRVKPFELFFDLVFVFGFTQVTAMMSSEPSWIGLARGIVILAAVWWAWGAYTWLATTIDLDEGGIRLVMLGVMAAMFIVALAIPNAFDAKEGTALLFGLTYMAVRVLHLVLYAVAGWGNKALLKSLWGMTPTSIIAPAIVTVALCNLSADAALAVFAGAMLLDYLGPLVGSVEGWKVSAEHFSERHGLILLIAIGESLIAVGAGLSGRLEPEHLATALLGVVVVSSFWWTYFDVVALVAAHKLASLKGGAQAALARDSYSYFHLPMIVGIILFALGIKKVMKYPLHHLDGPMAFALVGGVALYLFGHIIFRYRNIRTWNKQRCVVALALIGIFPMYERLDAIMLLTLIAGLMSALVAYEAIRFAEMRHKIRHHLPRHDHDHAHD